MSHSHEPTPGIVKVFLLVMLLFDSLLGWMIYNQLRIARWPTTAGVIEDVTVRESYSSTASAIKRCPRVTFRYDVAGETHRSDTFRFGGFCSSDSLDVDRVLQDLNDSSEPTVYYDPGRPDNAYLMAGLGRVEHTGLLFFLPFNLFALGWVLEILSRRVLGRQLEPESFCFSEDRDEVQARFPHLGPTKFTLGALLVVSFLLALGVVFLFDVLPKSFFVGLWIGLALFTAALWIGKAAWNRWGAAVITVDRRTGDLTAPGGRVLRRPQIYDWEVEEKLGASGKPVGFRTFLLYRDEDNAEGQRLALPILSTHEHAYRLSDWLVRQLDLDDRHTSTR